MLAAEELAEAAERADDVDLDDVWRERCEQFIDQRPVRPPWW